MIEWLIGAALIGIFGSGRDKKTQSWKSTDLPTDHSDYQANLSAWRAQWEAEVDRTRWIPKSVASHIVARFPPPERWNIKRPNAQNKFVDMLLREFAEHNISYIAKQKELMRGFFDTVEKNSLTEEQIEGCICMDDAVQIVAAAGSGKTSTMVAKVGYALSAGLVKPEQILILAFNRTVAEELQFRIADRLASFENIDAVTIKTFNAFGLSVIASATKRKPSLADWAQQGRDVEMILRIINDLRQSNAKFRHEWDLFRIVYGRDIGHMDAPPVYNAFSNGRPGILTANGDVVRSQEERMIADRLFLYGIDYRYEQKYEHDTVTEHHGQYRPDFYYPEIDLYHEHFALNENGSPPLHFTGDYLSGVTWKRKLHEKMGTRLLETTSFEIRGEDGLEVLISKLEKEGITLDFNPERPAKGQSPVTNKQLANTLRVFQQHVKSNGLSHQKLREIASSERSHPDRQMKFLSLYGQISDEWERRLREIECVDFDDMLLMATEHIATKRFSSPYTMILTDEFQDTSQSKVNLLKTLLKSAGDQPHLCVVGDDYQGINRFAGADISVMTEFDKVFDHSTRLMLNTTFRCPAHLCDASSEFIQTNPRQITKSVKTTNTYVKKSLLAYAATSQELARFRLEEDLKSMDGFVRNGSLKADGGAAIKVMLLGRYNRDEPPELSRWQRQFGSCLDIEFRTIHASKGLEADYVMLLNLIEGSMGFPSQITDDPLLQLAMPEPDPFPLAEERRLFYVALTRARRQVRIFTELSRPSRFLCELVQNKAVEIETESGPISVCPKCGQGAMKVQSGKFGLFEVCSSSPQCNYKRNAPNGSLRPVTAMSSQRLKEKMDAGAICPICNIGAMVVRSKGSEKPFLGCSKYPTCKTTAPLKVSH